MEEVPLTFLPCFFSYFKYRRLTFTVFHAYLSVLSIITFYLILHTKFNITDSISFRNQVYIYIIHDLNEHLQERKPSSNKNANMSKDKLKLQNRGQPLKWHGYCK